MALQMTQATEPVEGQFSLSSIAEQETPTFNLVGQVLGSLALCMRYSVSPKAAGIKFNMLPATRRDGAGGVSVSLERVSDLGSELDRMSSNGFKTFSDANRQLNRIRNISANLAQSGGSLATLQLNFGNPGEAANNERLLNRIEQDANRYSEAIETIETMFEAWQEDIRCFKEALYRVQSTTAEDAQRQLEDLKRMEVELNAASHGQQDARSNVQRAESRYLEAAAAANPKTSSLGLYYPKSSSMLDYALSATSFVRAGWAWISSNSTKSTAEAERAASRELEQRRLEAERCHRLIMNATARLEGLNQQKIQTDEFAKALAEALWALQFIGGQALAVMTQFNHMSESILEFANTHRPRLLEVARADSEEQASLIDQVQRDTFRMRECALLVEHLAWLYAEIIRQVMVNGFQGLRAAAQPFGNEDKTSLMIIDPRKANARGLYLTDGTSFAADISAPVDRAYRETYGQLLRSSSQSNISQAPQRNHRTSGGFRNGVRNILRRR